LLILNTDCGEIFVPIYVSVTSTLLNKLLASAQVLWFNWYWL